MLHSVECLIVLAVIGAFESILGLYLHRLCAYFLIIACCEGLSMKKPDSQECHVVF